MVLLLGPRQCGKTTPARAIARERSAHYFDLEDSQCPLLADSAGITLRGLEGTGVIDGFQRSLVHLRADRDAFFYKTHAGAERDPFLIRDGKRLGFEFEFQDAPRVTKSMRVVADDLRLDRLFVVYPGSERYALGERIELSKPLRQGRFAPTRTRSRRIVRA